ncbi:MAG: hypothetical protein IJ057_10380 [Bacteroidales bacterium]|nr:hypothetical protein [Bacteroidales bacterium]
MFIETEEMKSVLYEYQMMQIADNDEDIITDGIMAAVSEVRGYFEAANARRETAGLTQQQYAAWKIYDVDAIFNATGTDRNAFVVRLCKRIAAWNICDLANVDIINDRLKERYELTISTLEKIAGMGDHAQSRLVLSELPSPQGGGVSPSQETDTSKPFRMISRPKFNHE